MPSRASFYFDLASPRAYLVAERVLHVFARPPVPVEWQPVLAARLSAVRPSSPRSPGGGEAVAPGGLRAEAQAAWRAGLELRARELALQPLRWPAEFPFDSELAMLAATYAKSIGRTVPFAQAAFRQAYAGGRSLADVDSVLIAAAACEMHPTAVLRAVGLRSVVEQLQETTADAVAAGVSEVPAITIDGHVFAGESAVDQAALHMASQTRTEAR